MVDEPDSISHEVVVRLPQEEAFHLFAYGFASWWPPEYTWSGKVLETIGFETFAGGRCTEHGPLGFQCDWGRVLVWSPPQRLVLAWQIGPNRQPQPDPENASRIEILFRSRSAGTTRLLLTHRDIRRHGKGAARYRQALGSAPGWPLILECYADAAMART
jgi:uncharacterized protein YndB with AHSA1/START domain